jgi:hypothetical protein
MKDIPQRENIFESVSTNVKLEWRYNRRLIIYHYKRISFHQEVADIRKKINEVVANWPLGQPYCVVYNFLEVTWAPQMREQADEDYRIIPPDLKAYMAIVLPNTPLNQLVKLFVLGQQRKSPRHIQTNAFTSLDRALVWCLAALNTQPYKRSPDAVDVSTSLPKQDVDE